VTVRFSSIAVFDAEGKLVEDTGQKIDEIKLPAVDQVSDFAFSRDKFVQIYRGEKELHISTTERGEITKALVDKQPIRLKSEADVLRSDSEEGALRHWYGQRMYFWGYETVREPKGDGTRHVFYINAINIIP